jgi:hypothetical protein
MHASLRTAILLAFCCPLLANAAPPAHGDAPKDTGPYYNPKDMPKYDGTECLKTAGRKKANQLYNECFYASASSHPICDTEYSCATIIYETGVYCRTLRNPPSYPGLSDKPTPLSKLPKACLKYLKPETTK